ncbi:ribonuclease H-like domain-containing protein [Tanacetum coccineum]
MTFINANVLSNFVSLQCLSSLLNALLQNTMAEQNVPAQPPTRTDEQIVPRSQWLTIGKSNLLFNAQKIQKNPIFQISVDILSNTNFFQAFTASANVPAIYLQQFWKTMSYNEKTGVYSCQVDEQWFDLSADLLRKALAITPVNPTHPFELPPSGDTVIDFVNELGYPEPVEIVSSIRVNYVYQPWRAILSLLNQCLTGKTSGSDKPRHPVLQMLWGIVTQTNVDHAELIWEEFTQGIQTFFSHKASHKASLKNPKKKVTPLLIPYGRFSKVIIYYLASNNNIHRRPDSAVHHTGDDYVLGNLKFVPKGESVEVFGMAIPDPLITEAIQQSSYYPKYQKMVAENTKKTPQGSASMQPATKRATPKKPTTTTPVKQSKPAPSPTKKPSKRKLPQKIRKGKPTFHLVDEEDEAQQESNPQEEGNDPELELAKKLRLETHQEKGEREDKEIHESSSTSDSERTESDIETAAPKDDKDQGEVDSSTVTSGVSILVSDLVKAHEALAGPDPEPMKEDQTGSDSGKLHVSLAGPNPEHMDDEFLATVYPKVHENLKLITDKHVFDDKPESQSGSMSFMKNLDDTVNFRDQFLHDKPTEDDQEKSKVREESDSTIPDSSHQTVTSTPPVIPPFTEVSSSKPSLLVTPPPINTEATTITTSLPEITPFIALQLRVARLEQEMSEVKKTDHSADVLASIRSQVPTAVDNYLGTKLDDALLKVLERHTADLIEKYSVLPGPESVKNQESEKSPKEIIKAKKEQDEEKQDSTYSIRSTDKVDLEEFDLKSALFSHMNKKKSANKNTTNYRLYHALMEALIADEDAMDKEVADKVKDHKRKHDSDDDEDDDDDEGPSAGSNQADDQSSKKKTRESEAMLPNNITPLLNWMARSLSQREDGVDYSMHRSDPESNIFEQSSDDIQSREKGNDSIWRTLTNAHIPQGPAFNLVKAFHKNSVFLQYQMDECHKLLTNKVDLSNPEGHQILRNIYEPLPLGGPPGQVTKSEKLPYPYPSSKAGSFLDFGLEELVPSLWVESESEYDISAVYGITHWWFRRKEFYINKHSESSDREAVRSQMRILSVISVKVFKKYGYNYLREIILRRANYQEYKISEKDFKNLHPNDFEDLFLLNIQEKLNHLPKTDKTSLHTAVNMAMETRKWSEDDKRRSKDFITAIEKRLQIRRIYRSLESFVGGRIRDIDYRLIKRTTNRVNSYAARITKMIADIEDSHHGHSDAMQQPSLASESFKRFLFHFSQRLNTLSINFLTPRYLKDGDGDGNSQPHKGVKASANSDVMYFFTSAQDGDPSQDDVRLCLGDDLKKAQDHSQRQALTASRHWSIHQLNVKNAFLHGDLSETVYMHQPPGFQDYVHPDYVCLLQRSLYGLKQAPKAWFQRFASYITRDGFSHSRCDSSLFIYKQGTDTSYLLLYVDDIVLTTSSKILLQQIIRSLHQEFAMTDLGPLNYFLGISVTRDSSGLFLSLKKYAVEILDKAHMVNCNPSRTPIDTESKLGSDGDPVSDPTLYRSLTDADWAGCPTTHRSTFGYCVFLGNNLLSWSSKRQPTLSRSSAEAEYRGVANVVVETCWLRNLLHKLHTPLSSATLVYCDNVSSSASRDQFADIFTKGLPSALFKEFRSSLSVCCPHAPTAGEC